MNPLLENLVYFIRGDLILAIYIDNILLFYLKIGPIKIAKDELSKVFKIVNIGEVKFFLRIKVKRLNSYICLS